MTLNSSHGNSLPSLTALQDKAVLKIENSLQIEGLGMLVALEVRSQQIVTIAVVGSVFRDKAKKHIVASWTHLESYL